MIKINTVKLFVVFYLVCWILTIETNAQSSKIRGHVKTTEQAPVFAALVSIPGTNFGTLTDSNGNYVLRVTPGNYLVTVKCLGYSSKTDSVNLSYGQELLLNFTLKIDSIPEIVISGNVNTTSIDRLEDVEGTSIYAGKKNEVILIDKINANTATNNTRQLFAKVPGVNIIENDGSGISMSIATRGLNPNRITEFNSRQNGYDISADPIGYPESYYTPPSDALSKIEIVRGAASLQYGSQFGGLLNFVFRQGNPKKPIEVFTKQTAGSYGFFNSFNSVGGTHKKISYYCFYNHKQGNGWRQNSQFNINTAFFSVKDSITRRLVLSMEYTYMKYNMKQPGGLTDALFNSDPRASYRNRNWFSAGWHMPAIIIDYKLGKNTKINSRTYALIAYRSTVGNLNSINVIQPDTGYRTVMFDNYFNIANETRLLHEYGFLKKKSTVVVGFRYFRGHTQRRQGNGSAGSNADYNFNEPNNQLEGMNFSLPSTNIAIFAENVFKITNRFTVTPGIRFEHITTKASGYYLSDSVRYNENQINPRHFFLMGLGLGYKLTKNTNVYANYSQNYSPVNYSDVYVLTPDQKVDPHLKDVTGYNADMGWRGNIKNILTFDVGAFLLYYNNRIGTLLEVDNNNNIYQYTTNIANSRSEGIESYTELDIFKLLNADKKLGNLSIYATVAYTNAIYIKSPSYSIIDKRVENAPSWVTRYGCSYKYKKFSTTIQYSYVSFQYTDATNSVFSADGVTGVIPAYFVVDYSANYSYKRMIFGFSINNLTNNMYFTRRTSGMPGPGIVSSDGRCFYITVGFRL